MTVLLQLLLLSISGLVTIPALIFFVEVTASIVAPREPVWRTKTSLPPRIAVIVPARDESAGLPDTLANIQAQLPRTARLVVVADNCSDDTAAIAAAAGAEVVERHDLAKIGKGYALDCGLRHLASDPPEVVIIVDADCKLGSHALDRLASTCASTGRPVQAAYLMAAPDQSCVDHRVATFAFRIKNLVRPLGLRALNLPCQLMGTGMAFPWRVISAVAVASEQEVEDLQLGLDLTRAGHPPLFFPLAAVNSQFPAFAAGAGVQRRRWERGHIRLIATQLPRLLHEALRKRNFALLVLACDAAIPPLTLLGLMVSSTFALAALGAAFGMGAPALVVGTASLSLYLCATLMCWWKFGRDLLPIGSVRSVVAYIAGKLPLYRHVLFRERQAQWIRTGREQLRDGAETFPNSLRAPQGRARQ